MQFYMIRGVPGSGKSTFAKSLLDTAHRANKKASHFEADQFFHTDGVYKFDRSRLSEVHELCFSRTKEAMEQKQDFVIVSNTSTTEKEVTKYLDLAKSLGYTTHVVVVENWHGGSNIHGVPDAVVSQMRGRLKNSLR